MGDKGDNTTTQKTAPDPRAMAGYRDVLNRASGVANTPYQAYGGDLTAGVNAQQNLGIANINNATQAGQPWFDYASSMAHPIGTSDIQRYLNPYTQNVVDATQAQFDRSNAQQQEGLKGRAIAQGALGGSRANIAAADMGYQQQQGQAPVIAGLYNQGYNTAVQTAQQQQQAGFQGAGVGANIQQAGLQGAGAQIGAGTLQQQTEQQRLAAEYQQYQLAQAFPYQQAQWLAGINTGVGSQMGGTSTTTAPAPNPLSTIAGVGLTAAGAYFGGPAGAAAGASAGKSLFGAAGGRINGYDAGGSVGSDPYGGVGWIPRMQITRGPGAPHAPAAPQSPHPSFDPKKFAFPQGPAGVAGPLQLDPYATEGAGVGDINPLAPQSGLDPNGQNRYADGGAIPGYADGGSPFDPREWGRPDPVPEDEGFWAGVGRDVARYAPQALRAVVRLQPRQGGGAPMYQVRGKFRSPGAPMRPQDAAVMNSPLVAGVAGASLIDWDKYNPDTFMDRWADMGSRAQMGSPVRAGVGAVSDDVEMPVHLPRGDSFDDRWGEMLPPWSREREIPEFLQAGVGNISPAARFDAPMPRRNPYAVPMPRENPFREGYAVGGAPSNPWDNLSFESSGVAPQWLQGAQQNAPPTAGFGPAPMPPDEPPPSYEGGATGGLGFKIHSYPGMPENDALGYAPREDRRENMPVGGEDDARSAMAQFAPGVAPMPRPSPFREPSYDETLRPPMPIAGVGAAPAPQGNGFDWSSLSMPLMTAGLGMMASRSPHLGVAIGEGGLQGVQAYAEQKKQTAERGMQEKKMAMDARRLDQLAQQSREQLALRTREVNLHERTAESSSTRHGEELELKKRAAELSALQPTKIGMDAYSREIFAVKDPKTGKYLPIDPDTGQIKGADGVDAGPVVLPTGADVLKSIPEGQKSIVQGLADYSINPNSLSTKGGHRERLLDMTKRFDPSYEQALYPARAAALKEFLAGGVSSPAGQITAGNTAIQHAADMLEAAERMRGQPGMWNAVGSMGIPLVSKWANSVNDKLVQGTPSGQALADFMTARNHFSEEVTKFYSGSGGSEAERQRALDNLDNAKSIEELRTVIKTEAKLMSGKINSLQSRYQNALGDHGWNRAIKQAGSEFPIVQKKSEEAMKHINAAGTEKKKEEGAPKVGERKQFKQGWGVWDGSKWAPAKD